MGKCARGECKGYRDMDHGLYVFLTFLRTFYVFVTGGSRGIVS